MGLKEALNPAECEYSIINHHRVGFLKIREGTNKRRRNVHVSLHGILWRNLRRRRRNYRCASMAMTVAASSSMAVMIPRVPSISARCSAVPYLPTRSFGRSSFTVPVKLLSGDRFIFRRI